MATVAQKKDSSDSQEQTIPVYRDSLPLDTRIDKVALPKLAEKAPKPPQYLTDPDTRQITNSAELGLTLPKDDEAKPNIAVLDAPAPSEENGPIEFEGKKYQLFTSHLRHVVDSINTDQLEIKTVYNIGTDGVAGKISAGNVIAALKHLVEHSGEMNIKFLNCSFTSKMTYPEARRVLQEFGPKDYTGIISPESLKEDREVLAAALEKYLASAAGRLNYPGALEEAELYRQLIGKGIAVVAGAGNDGRQSFSPVHVLVPDIFVVAGLNGSQVDEGSTDHSLVDTAQSFRAFQGDLSNTSGTSLATPSALSSVEHYSQRGRSIPQINDILRANLDVQVRGQLNTVVLPTVGLSLKFLTQLITGKDGLIDPVKTERGRAAWEALDGRFFASEIAALSVIRDHPQIRAAEALDLIHALDATLPGETISKKQLDKVFAQFAALPEEKRTAALTQMREGKFALPEVEKLLSP